MILQALVDYYESLAAQGKLAKPGWGTKFYDDLLNCSFFFNKILTLK